MPAGRPLELSKEHVEQTRILLARCLYVETVADALGVVRQTFKLWLRLGAREQRRRDRGKPPDPKLDLHCELSNAAKKVLADQSADYLAMIAAHGAQQWQALAWLMERRHPGQWATNRHEIRELQRRLAELERASGQPVATPPPRRPPGGKPGRADVE